jgi:hypothetical protein
MVSTMQPASQTHHSWYERTLVDLPWGEHALALRICTSRDPIRDLDLGMLAKPHADTPLIRVLYGTAATSSPEAG